MQTVECLAFVCTALTKIVAHAKAPFVPFRQGEYLSAVGMETQAMHNSNIMIRMMVVATPNRRRMKKGFRKIHICTHTHIHTHNEERKRRVIVLLAKE